MLQITSLTAEKVLDYELNMTETVSQSNTEAQQMSLELFISDVKNCLNIYVEAPLDPGG